MSDVVDAAVVDAVVSGVVVGAALFFLARRFRGARAAEAPTIVVGDALGRGLARAQQKRREQRRRAGPRGGSSAPP
jgi:hypothetical protein